MTVQQFPFTKEWYIGEIITLLSGMVFVIPLWYFVLFFTSSKDGKTNVESMLSSQQQAWVLEIFLGIVCMWMVWKGIALWLWVHNYSYTFEHDYITQRLGVISISEKHMPYSAVQNVQVNQGVFDRLLGIADVEIENAASVTVGTGKNTTQASDTITIEGLFLAEAQYVSQVLRSALLQNAPAANGL
jgi:uncharacterized membrane protein YdbT with pleckstrin-like domain